MSLDNEEAPWPPDTKRGLQDECEGAYLDALTTDLHRKPLLEEARRAYTLKLALEHAQPDESIIGLAADMEQYLKAGRPRGRLEAIQGGKTH